MSLFHYAVDLSTFDGEELERVFDLLDKWSFTGLKPTKIPKVFTLFAEEGDDIRKIVNLPEDRIRRIQ